MVETKSGTYSDFSDGEIAAFNRLVLSEGRVNEATLPELMKRAAKLVLLTSNNKIIGTAAIKTPNVRYRESVFHKAGMASLEESHKSELGWVVVASSHRGKGHSLQLIEQAVADLKKGIYATSQQEDDAMHRTLKRFGFTKTGSPYPSTENSNRSVLLFLRNA